MMKKIQHLFLSCFAAVLSFVTLSTVNSCCVILFGQPEEPDTLKRFKTIK